MPVNVDRIEDALNRALNGVVKPVLTSRFRWVIQPVIATITWTGRRSGREFSTPVLYRRRGDTVTIGVAAPSAKQWWRNFTDGGGPISIDLRGTQRTGHALASRSSRGRVSVRIQLDPAPPDLTS